MVCIITCIQHFPDGVVSIDISRHWNVGFLCCQCLHCLGSSFNIIYNNCIVFIIRIILLWWMILILIELLFYFFQFFKIWLYIFRINIVVIIIWRRCIWINICNIIILLIFYSLCFCCCWCTFSFYFKWFTCILKVV